MKKAFAHYQLCHHGDPPPKPYQLFPVIPNSASKVQAQLEHCILWSNQCLGELLSASKHFVGALFENRCRSRTDHFYPDLLTCLTNLKIVTGCPKNIIIELVLVM